MPRRGQRKAKLVLAAGADPHAMMALAIEYLEWMRVRNFSEETVRGREKYLRQFLDWCEQRAVLRPGEVTKPMLERYQRWLYHYRKADGRPLSARSQWSQLIPVRVFFKWLARANHILYNPAADLELPRLETRLPRDVLTREEVEAVLGAADVATAIGVRDRVMMEVLYSTGMRRSELVRLSIWDIQAERGVVLIREGKGKKDRVVPIGERALW